MPSTDNFSERIDFLHDAISEADHIIIGAGSGLSTAAGIDYAGEEFRCEFSPWIERYGFTYCGIIYLLNGDERLAYQKKL